MAATFAFKITLTIENWYKWQGISFIKNEMPGRNSATIGGGTLPGILLKAMRWSDRTTREKKNK